MEPSSNQVKKPVNTESLDTWRTIIPPAILERIWEECDMLKELGYPKDITKDITNSQPVTWHHLTYTLWASHMHDFHIPSHDLHIQAHDPHMTFTYKHMTLTVIIIIIVGLHAVPNHSPYLILGHSASL